MICLACGTDGPYRSTRCASCGRALEAFPPFLHANHVSQLLEALDRPDGEAEVGRFLDILDQFQATWGIQGPGSLTSRLPGPLQGRFTSALVLLERACDLLAEGVAMLERGEMENGKVLIMDFFRLACQGGAELSYELESLQKEDASGQLFDLKSS